MPAGCHCSLSASVFEHTSPRLRPATADQRASTMSLRISVLLAAGACLTTGCQTAVQLHEAGLASRPYAATRTNADVWWDVGLMRYQRYSDECPPIVGWTSLIDLPLTAVADTALLPFLKPQRVPAEPAREQDSPAD